MNPLDYVPEGTIIDIELEEPVVSVAKARQMGMTRNYTELMATTSYEQMRGIPIYRNEKPQT